MCIGIDIRPRIFIDSKFQSCAEGGGGHVMQNYFFSPGLSRAEPSSALPHINFDPPPLMSEPSREALSVSGISTLSHVRF